MLSVLNHSRRTTVICSRIYRHTLFKRTKTESSLTVKNFEIHRNIHTTSRSLQVERDFREEERKGGLGRSKISVYRIGAVFFVYLILQRVIGELLRSDEIEWDYEKENFVLKKEKEQIEKSKQ